MDLRNAILKKLEDSSINSLFDTITDAINTKEENILPGLGVLFEMIWTNSSKEEKEIICSKLAKQLVS